MGVFSFKCRDAWWSGQPAGYSLAGTGTFPNPSSSFQAPPIFRARSDFLGCRTISVVNFSTIFQLEKGAKNPKIQKLHKESMPHGHRRIACSHCKRAVSDRFRIRFPTRVEVLHVFFEISIGKACWGNCHSCQRNEEWYKVLRRASKHTVSFEKVFFFLWFLNPEFPRFQLHFYFSQLRKEK